MGWNATVWWLYSAYPHIANSDEKQLSYVNFPTYIFFCVKCLLKSFLLVLLGEESPFYFSSVGVFFVVVVLTYFR